MNEQKKNLTGLRFGDNLLKTFARTDTFSWSVAFTRAGTTDSTKLYVFIVTNHINNALDFGCVFSYNIGWH